MAREVQLTQGLTALIDERDWPSVSAHRWRAAFIVDRWYAVGAVDGNNNTYLHRFVMNAPRGVEVDHINHNELDCRRQNLRLATRRQNAENQKGAHRDSRTGVRGVSFDKRAGRYHVQVVSNYRNHSGGYYADLGAAESAAINLRRRLMTHSSECERPAELVAQLALPGMGIPT